MFLLRAIERWHADVVIGQEVVTSIDLGVSLTIVTTEGRPAALMISVIDIREFACDEEGDPPLPIPTLTDKVWRKPIGQKEWAPCEGSMVTLNPGDRVKIWGGVGDKCVREYELISL